MSFHFVIYFIKYKITFSSRYIEYVEKNVGKIKYNGYKEGMVGVVARNEAHAAIGAFTMYASRVRTVDFLIPLLEEK